MWIGKSFKVLRKNVFSYFWLGVLMMTMMETRKKGDGNAMVFMSFMSLCHFFLFGMSELEWMLLDTGWMWGKGATK